MVGAWDNRADSLLPQAYVFVEKIINGAAVPFGVPPGVVFHIFVQHREVVLLHEALQHDAMFDGRLALGPFMLVEIMTSQPTIQVARNNGSFIDALS